MYIKKYVYKPVYLHKLIDWLCTGLHAAACDTVPRA